MNGERGFTLIEVLIAVLILTVGLLGLVSTAALVTRMIGQGNRYTEASTVASQQFETFRSQWTASSCAGAVDGTTTLVGFTLSWRVTSVAATSTAAGGARQVQLTVSSPTGRGTRTDTFYRTIPCS